MNGRRLEDAHAPAGGRSRGRPAPVLAPAPAPHDRDRRARGAATSGCSLWAWGAGSSGQLGIGSFAGRLTGAGRRDHVEGAERRRDPHVRDPQQRHALVLGQRQRRADRHAASRAPSLPGRHRRPGRRSRRATAATPAAIRSNDTLWCWGRNDVGQLGDGTTTSRTSPVQIGTATWKTVATGYDHTCGIRSNDTLWCWGRNTDGEIGDGTTTNRTQPRPGRHRHLEDRRAAAATTPAGSGPTAPSGAGAATPPAQIGDGTTTLRTTPGPGRHRHLEDGHRRRVPQLRDPQQRHALVLGRQQRRAGRRRHHHQPHQPGPGRHRHLEDRQRRRASTRAGPERRHALVLGLQPVRPGRRRHHRPAAPAPSRSAPRTWKTVSSRRPAHLRHRHRHAPAGAGATTPTGSSATAPRPTQTQPEQIAALATWKQASAGDGHTCGIAQTDDTLWCWGHNAPGRSATAPPPTAPAPSRSAPPPGRPSPPAASHTCGDPQQRHPLVLGLRRPRPGRRRHHHQPDQPDPGRHRHLEDRHHRRRVTPAASAATTPSGAGATTTYGQVGDGTHHRSDQPGPDRHRHLEDGRRRHDLHLRDPQQRHALVLGLQHRRRARRRHARPRAISPVQIGTATWKTVAARLDHTCGIRTDDTLWCWGDNGSRPGRRRDRTAHHPGPDRHRHLEGRQRRQLPHLRDPQQRHPLVLGRQRPGPARRRHHHQPLESGPGRRRDTVERGRRRCDPTPSRRCDEPMARRARRRRRVSPGRGRPGRGRRRQERGHRPRPAGRAARRSPTRRGRLRRGPTPAGGPAPVPVTLRDHPSVHRTVRSAARPRARRRVFRRLRAPGPDPAGCGPRAWRWRAADGPRRYGPRSRAARRSRRSSDRRTRAGPLPARDGSGPVPRHPARRPVRACARRDTDGGGGRPDRRRGSRPPGPLRSGTPRRPEPRTRRHAGRGRCVPARRRSPRVARRRSPSAPRAWSRYRWWSGSRRPSTTAARRSATTVASAPTRSAS